MNILKKIFGTSSTKEVKRLMPIVNKIESLSEEYKALSDAELQAKTPWFKERLANGETLDDILPEAFAALPGGRRPRAGSCAPIRCSSSAASCSIRAVSPR